MLERPRPLERAPSLVEQVAASEALDRAWRRVQDRGGRTPGADGVTFAAFADDAPRRLGLLSRALREGTYRPRPLRRITLERSGSGPRRLSLPALRDRVVQAALLKVLTPRIDAVLSDAAYAYRRGRSHQQAAERLRALCSDGRPVVLRGDVFRFFESVPHAPLLARLDALLGDPALTALIGRLLATPVEGEAEPAGKGLPQGSALSPLLSNLYLVPFDETFARAGLPLVRYADDFAVACRSRSAARHAGNVARHALHRLGLRLHRTKTHITSFERGFRFLGQQLQARKASCQNDAHRPASSPSIVTTATRRTPRHDPPRPRSAAPRHASASASMPAAPAPSSPAPARPPRTLYLQTQGAMLSVSGHRFLVTPPGGGDPLVRLGIPKVGQVVTLGTVHLTPAAMKRCLTRGIPVTMLSHRGRYYGRLAATAHTSATRVRAQCALAADPASCLAVARTLIRAKIRNSRTLLRRYGRRLPKGPGRKKVAEVARRLGSTLRKATRASSLDVLRGIEGAAAAAYFGVLDHLLGPEAFSFPRRSRRPPEDPVNALLSFAYTLAHTKLHALAEIHRLHPYVGFLHADASGHPTLVSDLLEPFRPALDAFVLGYVNRGQVTAQDFERRDGGCFLRGEACARFVGAFEKVVRRKRPRSLWQAMDRQTAALARRIEDDASAFTAYRMA